MWNKLPAKVTSTFKHDPALVCYRGSHSHGTFVPSNDPLSIDDIDVFSVETPPITHYFGLDTWKGDDYWVDEYDIVEYPLAKYISLLSKGNPNCCMTLWLREEDYFLVSELGQELIDNRDIFIGKLPIFNAFLGYAHGQRKKMLAFQEYSGYMGAKRKNLVDQFGYDVKNAAHLIRLLVTLEDFLQTGDFYVYRRDAAMLLDIKKGRWDKVDVLSVADELLVKCQELYAKCPRPAFADRDTINIFVTECLWDYYKQTWNGM